MVIEGFDNITPPTKAEEALQKVLFFPPHVRLACQSYAKGSPIHVHRIIRDEDDIHLYIDEDTQSDLQNIGEEKELALFFLDIKNFTPFIENYLAFDVIHVMRRLFGLFRKCIEGHAGRIIETAGDGLYAVFGFTEDITTAVNNATQAGLAILHDLVKMERRRHNIVEASLIMPVHFLHEHLFIYMLIKKVSCHYTSFNLSFKQAEY